MGLFQMFSTYGNLKKGLEEKKLDFSEIDTPEKAAESVTQGKLVKIDLVPQQLSGKASPKNQVFVPKFAAEDKKQYDDMAEKLLREGKADNYSCKAKYRSSSQVPVMLDIEVKLGGNPILMGGVHIW